MTSNTKLYTAKEVGAMLNCADRTVRNIANKYNISKPLGSDSRRGIWLFTAEEIELIADKLAEYRQVRIPR